MLMGYLLNGVAAVLSIILNIAQILIIVAVVISWVGADPRNPIVQMIRQITEPMFKPFRGLTQRFTGPIDLAPLIVLLLIVFLQMSLIPWLTSLSRTLT